MTRAELVERIERALENAPKAKRATAALAAIEAAGVVLVPREATREMVEAGRNRPYREDDSDADTMDRNTDLTWSAMLAASPLAKAPGA